MEEKQINDLVIIEQLPVITQQLQLISDEIDKNIEYALSLECTEESKKEVKDARANLSKIKSTLETKRKEIKSAVMKPYEEFETIYKDLVTNKLNGADATLKTKIDEIEIEQKHRKEVELKEFAEEQIKLKHLEDYLDFDSFNLNITLSASMKSLETQIIDCCERIEKELKLIDLEDYKDEILVEYKKSLDYMGAKLNVIERHKQLEEMKKRQEALQQIKEQEKEIEEIVEENFIEIEAPVEIQETVESDKMVISFTVTGTKEQLKKLKQFLIEENIEYR